MVLIKSFITFWLWTDQLLSLITYQLWTLLNVHGQPSRGNRHVLALAANKQTIFCRQCMFMSIRKTQMAWQQQQLQWTKKHMRLQSKRERKSSVCLNQPVVWHSKQQTNSRRWGRYVCGCTQRQQKHPLHIVIQQTTTMNLVNLLIGRKTLGSIDWCRARTIWCMIDFSNNKTTLSIDLCRKQRRKSPLPPWLFGMGRRVSVLDRILVAVR